MRTLIVSDLHLGDPSDADLLRQAGPRERLLRELEGVDRLVLLGDVLELRESPAETAMQAARPLFEGLGSALADREIVLVSGNHDHCIVRREAGPLAATLAEWAAPARLTLAHPGIWLRPDVYATHGHYLDCHAGPTNGERLMLAAMQRVRGAPRALDGYESVTSTLYRGLERSAGLRRLAGSRMVARAGRLASGRRGETAVHCERTAMGEVAARLGLGEAYVVFGHTHRAGPFPGEDAEQWRGRLGARLVNCGCWTATSQAAVPQAAASQAGSCVIVDDGGPPAVVLLGGGDGSGAQQAAAQTQ